MSEATVEFVVEDVRFVSIIAGYGLSACHFKVPELPKSNQPSIIGWDMGLTRQNIPISTFALSPKPDTFSARTISYGKPIGTICHFL